VEDDLDPLATMIPTMSALRTFHSSDGAQHEVNHDGLIHPSYQRESDNAQQDDFTTFCGQHHFFPNEANPSTQISVFSFDFSAPSDNLTL
jgi:hypothetical protein